MNKWMNRPGGCDLISFSFFLSFYELIWFLFAKCDIDGSSTVNNLSDDDNLFLP